MKIHNSKILQQLSLSFLILVAAVLLTAPANSFAAGEPQHAAKSSSPSVRTVAIVSISYDGTKQSGSSNVTTSYDGSTGLYQIHIAAICFLRTSYTAVATVSGYNGYPNGALFVNTDDDGHYCRETGNLVVGLRDVNGNLQKADFQVLVLQSH